MILRNNNCLDREWKKRDSRESSIQFLNEQMLLEVHVKAVHYKLDPSFVNIIEDEIKSRYTNKKHLLFKQARKKASWLPSIS